MKRHPPTNQCLYALPVLYAFMLFIEAWKLELIIIKFVANMNETASKPVGKECWQFCVIKGSILSSTVAAPARVLSIASRANAKGLHRRWSMFRQPQSERHIPAAPNRTRELSLRLSDQRRNLKHVGASRLHTHASRNFTFKAVFFQYNFSSPLLCLWPSCHFLFGIDNESLHWRAQHFFGKSSTMSAVWTIALYVQRNSRSQASNPAKTQPWWQK